MGSAIIFDSNILMINKKGTANKKTIPKAVNGLVLPIYFKTAVMTHKKTMEAAAVTAPIENISGTLMKQLSKNK